MSANEDFTSEVNDHVEEKIVNKPIKKKAIALDEDDDGSEGSSDSHPADPHAIEIQARKDLHRFLSGKGVDPKLSDNYKIHVRLTKQRKDSGRKSDGYSVSYTCPDGSILMSKLDVLTSINDMKRKSQNTMKNWLNNANLRKDTHDQAVHQFRNASTPATFGTITVLSFGVIDKRNEFHTAVQIYPVGFQCEQTVTGTSVYKGNVKQTIICEISEVDSFPEFRITVKSTGDTYLAASEQAVWKKYNPNNLETDWNPSFFNLDIELLVEGMSGVLDCEHYKFHAERGYGTTYFTNDDSIVAKNNYLAKSGRERRNQERQRAKHLTKEEQDRFYEEQKKQLSDEKEIAKKMAAIEKERKEQEKEKLKQQREKQKQEDARRKEHTRAVVKSIKDKHRKSDKLRQQFKRDVTMEVRKNKNDASAIVLQYFDDEEELEEHVEQLAATSTSLGLESANSTITQFSSVREFINAIPAFDEQFELVSPFGDGNSSNSNTSSAETEDLNMMPIRTSIDEVMQITSTLHLFRKHLNIESSVNFDNVVNCMVSVSATSNGVCSTASNASVTATSDPETTSVSNGTELKVENVVESSGMDETSSSNVNEEVSETVSSPQDNVDIEKSGNETEKDEEEWDEAHDSSNRMQIETEGTSQLPTPSKTGSVATSMKNQSDMIIPEAEMDKVQLKLMKGLLHELHQTLDLENVADGSGGSGRLPLNQLTWQELARMSIINFIFSEMGRTKEDTLHAIRGGKHPSYKTAKNIVRNIRYKMYLKSMGNTGSDGKEGEPIPDWKARTLEEMKWLDSICRFNASETRKPSPNAFNTESELLNSLDYVSSNPLQYPEVYRRCAKILIKILNMSSAKNLIWEIDSEAYPDYYSTISRPIMFANIATNLVNRSYSDDESITEIDGVDTNKMVAMLFYSDMMQVVINCFTYNTEVTLIVAQAYKVVAAIRRFVQLWLLDANRPPVENCDDKVCLLTGTPVFANTPGSILKCGKCNGNFSCNAILFKCSESERHKPENRFIVKPSNMVIDQTNEEWVCSFCMSESFVAPYGSYSPFFIDEWGRSGVIPWFLNLHHSAKSDDFQINMPHLMPLFDALRVLSRTDISSVCDRTEITAADPLGVAIERTCSRWNFADRVTVLGALCRVLRTCTRSLDFINKVYTDCEKLMRIGNKPTFREADFMDVVKELAGEDGVTYCRSLFDGIDSSEAYLQNIITEGRCVVCNCSTLEEDMAANSEEGEAVDEIILCDGCNAEVHLKCLNLTVVPSSEWYCNFCKDRISLRDSKVDRSFDNVDKHRDRDIEDELVGAAVERRCLLEDDENNRAKFEDETKCCYCGMSEYDLCSPLVVGQSRSEHDAVVGLCAKTTIANYPAGKQQNVKFLIDGTEMTKPTFDFPYFPLVESSQGQKLINAAKSIDQDVHIAHQVCALQMFQARAYRNRHNIRRRRKVIGKRVVAMSGIATKPLGYDDSGLEFWKLPTSEDLFIFDGSTEDKEKLEFEKLIGKVKSQPMESDIDRDERWKRISDLNDIRRIVDLLGPSLCERNLKKNLIFSLLMDRKMPPPAPTVVPEVDAVEMSVDASTTNVEDTKSESVTTTSVPASNAGRPALRKQPDVDNIPVALKLLTNKGSDILKTYVIQEETVFEESGDVDDEEQEGNSEYFTFSKNRKYYATALINAADGIVKANSKTKLTIIYQIHREGISAPLTYAPLSEAWSDHLYYFSTVTFKKSGRYTISFIAEGANAASIKPLIFPVHVEARFVRCGLTDALRKLNASVHVQDAGRAVLLNRREVTSWITRTDSELSALKGALFCVYAALPNGALMTGTDDTNNFDDCITEPSGWNDVLDQLWRGAVIAANTPQSLMECVLLLEYYVVKAWLVQPRLLSCLPSSHFAIRCATYSSVGLRIFGLDKAMDYDKVFTPPREKRAYGMIDIPPSKSSVAKPSRGYEDDHNGRSQRSSAALASQRIRSQTSNADLSDYAMEKRQSRPPSYHNSDEYFDNEDERQGYRASSSSQPQSWTCPCCSTVNEARARSCAACDERKPATIARPVERYNPRPKRNSGGRGRHGGSDDDDDDESEGDNSNDAESDSDGSESGDSDENEDPTTPRPEEPTKKSSRKRNQVSYAEDEDANNDNYDMYFKPSTKKSKNTPKTFEINDYYKRYIDNIPVRESYYDELIEAQKQTGENGEEEEANVKKNIQYLTILRKFVKEVRSEPFWEPVDTTLVPEYLNYISDPMDLGTITERVVNGYYSNSDDPNAFPADVRLVWQNCKTFNMDYSLLHQDATILGKLFEDLYYKIVLQGSDSS